MRRVFGGLLWLVILATVIVACTGGEEETKATDEPAAVAVEETEVEPEPEPVEDVAAQERAFDEALGSQLTEFGDGLGLIGELFMLLSTDPFAGQSEEFEYASSEVVKMLDRMHDNANALDPPETRQQAKQEYIQIIEQTQQAVNVAFEGITTLDSEQITEGGQMMDEVNQMIETFVDGFH